MDTKIHSMLPLYISMYLNSPQSYNGIDSVVLLESFFCGFWALNLSYVVCEIGQRFSNAFTDLYDTICQLELYLYPTEVQQMFILIISYAQKPVDIAFFGSSACNRRQFRKVQSLM